MNEIFNNSSSGYYPDSEYSGNSEYASDTESFTEENSIYSNSKRYKHLLNFIKKKGYYKFKKIINNRAYKIGFYETSTTPGSLIRNAITDYVFNYDCCVGTYKEDLYFKVCNTTIENGKRTPIIMFFESPEEFEKHFKCVVSDDNKNRWRLKYENALRRYEEKP